VLSVAADHDLPAAVDLLAAVYPDALFTVAGMRHRSAARPDWAQELRLKWEEAGRLAAWSTCALPRLGRPRAGVLRRVR
jgi:hypothetical protein